MDEFSEPGVMTSEFFLNLIIVIGTFVLVLVDKVDVEVWLVVSGLQGGTYALARTYRKVKHDEYAVAAEVAVVVPSEHGTRLADRG